VSQEASRATLPDFPFPQEGFFYVGFPLALCCTCSEMVQGKQFSYQLSSIICSDLHGDIEELLYYRCDPEPLRHLSTPLASSAKTLSSKKMSYRIEESSLRSECSIGSLKS
jgi:hypothetical protein